MYTPQNDCEFASPIQHMTGDRAKRVAIRQPKATVIDPYQRPCFLCDFQLPITLQIFHYNIENYIFSLTSASRLSGLRGSGTSASNEFSFENRNISIRNQWHANCIFLSIKEPESRLSGSAGSHELTVYRMYGFRDLGRR